MKVARTVATHASKWAPFAIAGTAAVCTVSYYLYKRRKQPMNHPTRKSKLLPATALVPTAIIASLTPFAAPSLLSTMNSVAPTAPQHIPQGNAILRFFKELSVKKILGATLSATWRAVKFLASTRPGKIAIAAGAMATVTTLAYKAYKLSRTRRMLRP